MTESEAKQISEAIVFSAAKVAEQKGITRDRCAATLFEAGVMLMITEVGPMGAAAVIRQMADRIELGDAEVAGHG